MKKTTIKRLASLAILAGIVTTTSGCSFIVKKLDTSKIITPKTETVTETTASEPVELAETTTEAETAETTKAPTKAQKLNLYYDIPLEMELQDYVREQCDKYGLRPELVYAIIKVESSYDRNCVNGSNYGLMQINSCNFEAHELYYPLTAFENIRVGTEILGELAEKYDNEDKILMAYNLGEGGAASLWNSGTYSTYYCEKVHAAEASIVAGPVYYDNPVNY